MIKNMKWLLLVSITFVACNSDEPDTSGVVADVIPVAGSADFSKYVALGNSLTAGYSDGALFIAGQENAYPNLLAQQFALVGGGEFNTPFMNDNIGGLLLGGNQIPGQGPRLFFNGTAPVPVTGPPTTEITNILAGQFNNMGVPGAKSFHLVANGYGNAAGILTGQANPYYVRFASSASASILEDAIAQAPTFFSLWIGNNDVLAYATSGGTGANQLGNTDPTTYGPNDITDPTVFAGVYNILLDGLTAGGAKGVVANLPYVTSIPFFRTVPFNPVALDAATAAQLNTGYAQYNGGLQLALANNLISADEAALRTITFAAGATNAVVIVDSYLTNLSALGLPSYRQATAEDLILLTARSFIGTTVGGNPAQVNGVSVPLADNWVLSKNEVAEIKTATDAYNATIKSLADAKGLAFVDTNSALNQVANGGVIFDNFHMTATYVQGGAFSLDGVHPTARGQAYIANKFIDAILAKYGGVLPKFKAQDFPLSYPRTLPSN